MYAERVYYKIRSSMCVCVKWAFSWYSRLCRIYFILIYVFIRWLARTHTHARTLTRSRSRTHERTRARSELCAGTTAGRLPCEIVADAVNHGGLLCISHATPNAPHHHHPLASVAPLSASCTLHAPIVHTRAHMHYTVHCKFNATIKRV